MKSNNKFVGGRGKKAPYKTHVMRVPEPLKEQVQYLIDNYRNSLTLNKNDKNDIILLSKDNLKKEIESILKKRKSAKISFEALIYNLFSY